MPQTPDPLLAAFLAGAQWQAQWAATEVEEVRQRLLGQAAAERQHSHPEFAERSLLCAGLAEGIEKALSDPAEPLDPLPAFRAWLAEFEGEVKKDAAASSTASYLPP